MRIVLQRAGETISIGTDIRFTILAIEGNEVQIGIAKRNSKLAPFPLHPSSSLSVAEPDANFYRDGEDFGDFP
jgi:hypothetical protein